MFVFSDLFFNSDIYVKYGVYQNVTFKLNEYKKNNHVP